MEIAVVFLKSSAGFGEILTRIVVENYGLGAQYRAGSVGKPINNSTQIPFGVL